MYFLHLFFRHMLPRRELSNRRFPPSLPIAVESKGKNLDDEGATLGAFSLFAFVERKHDRFLTSCPVFIRETSKRQKGKQKRDRKVEKSNSGLSGLDRGNMASTSRKISVTNTEVCILYNIHFYQRLDVLLFGKPTISPNILVQRYFLATW